MSENGSTGRMAEGVALVVPPVISKVMLPPVISSGANASERSREISRQEISPFRGLTTAPVEMTMAPRAFGPSGRNDNGNTKGAAIATPSRFVLAEG